jgi:hypothetical protein
VKTKHLLTPLVLGLGLALGLVWLLGGETTPATATESTACHAAPMASNVISVCASGGCDYMNVQAAVDAANPGDVIKVSAGTYVDIHQRDGITQVVYISKSVTIRGGYLAPNFTDPPDPVLNLTRLDASNQGRVVYITGDISPTLEGLYITGGDATGLGGGPGPYDGTGGGIHVISATATIRNCTIFSNTAGRNGWSAGGGLYLYNSPATLVDNIISNNTAGMSTTVGLSGEGGGVSLSGSDAALIGNIIMYNTASDAGGGIGGGIYTEMSTSTLRNNIVRDNTASSATHGDGGGIYVGPLSYPTLINTVLVGNFSGTTVQSRGGALAVEWADPRLLHTTIYNNSGADGTAIHVMYNSTVILTNTIVAVHTTAGITVSASSSTSTVNGVLWYNNGVNAGGSGTISVTNELTGNPNFAADGYHLQPGSKAIDAGVEAGVAEDIDGSPRNTPDLGADEFGVATTVGPDVGDTIIYTDTQGLTTTIEIPPGAVVETVTIAFSPLITPGYPLSTGWEFVGHAFDLDGYCAPLRVYLPLAVRNHPAIGSMAAAGESATSGSCSTAETPDFIPCDIAFQTGVTITIFYSDQDVQGILDEDTLRLDRWTGTGWQDVAETCIPSSTYITDTLGNMLQVATCHLSRHSMRGR